MEVKSCLKLNCALQLGEVEKECGGIWNDCCLKEGFAIHALVSICSGLGFALGFQGLGLLFRTPSDKIRVVCLIYAQQICLPEKRKLKHGKHDDVQEGW